MNYIYLVFVIFIGLCMLNLTFLVYFHVIIMLVVEMLIVGFLDSFCPEPQLIAERQATLNQSYAQLQDLAAARRERLEASQVLQRFYVDADEEESWIREQEQILIKTEQPKDLTSVRHLQQKQQVTIINHLIVCLY